MKGKISSNGKSLARLREHLAGEHKSALGMLMCTCARFPPPSKNTHPLKEKQTIRTVDSYLLTVQLYQ